MSIKTTFTDHQAWSGLKFELTGEARIAREIAVTDDMMEMLDALKSSPVAIPFVLTTTARTVLSEALLAYWSLLADRAADYRPSTEPKTATDRTE